MTALFLAVAFGAILGFAVGYVLGTRDAGQENWLTPTVRRQQAQLNQAWDTIERLQHHEDDFAERGIGR